MHKIKVKGKWQYFDGDRRITEAEYNTPKKELKKTATKKEKVEKQVIEEPKEAEQE